MTPQFTLKLRVAEAAIDEMRHVNNAVYLQYIELAARGHAEANGLSTNEMIALGGVFVVRRHEVDYFAPAHVDEELEIRTAIVECKGPRAVRLVEIWREERRLISARTEWIWIDPVTRQPKRIPPAVAAALPPHEGG